MVAECGQSRVLSAEGELPYPTRSGETGRYLDLSGPSGAFATLDYGDGSEAPRLFAGTVLAPDAVRITDHAVGPRPEHRVDTARLAGAIGATKIDRADADAVRDATGIFLTGGNQLRLSSTLGGIAQFIASILRAPSTTSYCTAIQSNLSVS